MSSAGESQWKAIAELYLAADRVVRRHDEGTLSMAVGDSASIEALRRALLEAYFAKPNEGSESK